MTNESTITNVNIDACSYEFGKPGNRFKLYFTTAWQLHELIEALKKWGFPVDSAFEITNKKEVGNNEPNNEFK